VPAASSASSSVIRRGRATAEAPERRHPAPAEPINGVDVASLTIGGSQSSASAPRSSAKPARAHGSGLSSMFAPPSHSPEGSPTRSPVSSSGSDLADWTLSASGLGSSNAPQPTTAFAGISMRQSVRPRIGRPTSTASVAALDEPAPPLSQHLIGSGTSAAAPAARSSSATSVRPSAAFAQASRTKPPRAAAEAHLASPEDLVLGSDSGAVLTGGSARLAASRHSSSARLHNSERARRTTIGGVVHVRAHVADTDFAPSVSSLARTEATDAEGNETGGPRAWIASSSSTSSAQARRSTLGSLVAPRSSGTSIGTSPPLGSSPPAAFVSTSPSTFGLTGSTFNALDRGENAMGVSLGMRSAASAGKLRKGKTALSGVAAAR
jgi:hypothetical protein